MNCTNNLRIQVGLVIRVALLLLPFQLGCNVAAVRRQAVNQTETWMDIQYQQVIDNLAMTANNPDVLPSYCVQDYGTASVTDKFGIVGILGIPPLGSVASGSLDPQASRVIANNW